MATIVKNWGARVEVEPRGSGLKLSTGTHEYLDRLRREHYIPKATAASNLANWMRDLDEPKAVDLMILNLSDSGRRRIAARAVIRAIARQSLPPGEAAAVVLALADGT